MNLYMDSSALIKRYITEQGSREIDEVFEVAETIGACAITPAEIAAAFARAVRMRSLSEAIAWRQFNLFRIHWQAFVSVAIAEPIVVQAENLAWQYGLRGYDAIHLSSALAWQSSMRSPIVMATFDTALWHSARQVGLEVFPPDLAAFTNSTSRRN